MAGNEPSKSENKMTPAERESLLKHLAESRERLLHMAQGLTREQLHYCPAPSRWTVAECLEHIVMVETRIFGGIQKALGSGPDLSKRSAMEGQDEMLIVGAAKRLGRFQAPEPLVPTGRWPDEQILQEFEAARERTREFAASTQADLRRHFFPHRAFGELDLYQWLLLIAGHCDRHRAQSEEVMSDPKFPRAEQANAPA